ncbi:MAG: hypothetical protein R3B40_07890 [Polyangiales bacterium]
MDPEVPPTPPGFGDHQGSTVRVNGAEMYASTYERDGLGRITESAETVEGVCRVQGFEDNDAGRVVSAADWLDAPVARHAPDLRGNRTRGEPV